jgi:ferrous iron transport protein A
VSTNLSKLGPGARARILKVGAVGPMKRRLMDMGLLPGEEIAVQKVAPLGDPMEVTVKSYSLSLRKKEAEGIAVEVLT